MPSESYIVGRVWSFAPHVRFLDALIPFVSGLPNVDPQQLSLRIFDGRYERSRRLPKRALTLILPNQFCSLTISTSSRKTNTVASADGTNGANCFDLQMYVGPFSPIWAVPEVVPDATRSAQRKAFADESAYRSLQKQPFKELPHHVDFQVTRQGRPASQADVERIVASVEGFIQLLGDDRSVAGGIDVVNDYKEMGELGLVGTLSGEPERFAALKKRFDATHQIMFGPASYFSTIGAQERDLCFNRFEELANDPSYVVATAKTHNLGRRNFVHPLPQLVLTAL